MGEKLVYPNMTSEELEAVDELSQNPNITFQSVDKGGNGGCVGQW